MHLNTEGYLVEKICSSSVKLLEQCWKKITVGLHRSDTLSFLIVGFIAAKMSFQ